MCIAACDKTGSDPDATYQCPVCGFGSVRDSYVAPQSVIEARDAAALFRAAAAALESLVMNSASEEDLKSDASTTVQTYCDRAQQYVR